MIKLNYFREINQNLAQIITKGEFEINDVIFNINMLFFAEQEFVNVEEVVKEVVDEFNNELKENNHAPSIVFVEYDKPNGHIVERSNGRLGQVQGYSVKAYFETKNNKPYFNVHGNCFVNEDIVENEPMPDENYEEQQDAVNEI